MELSSRVKSPVEASTKTPQLYKEKILVAMDVTLEKIQKLLKITTLCLYLSEDPQKFTRSRRNKLEAVLGKDASELLGELVSCQKKQTGYMSSPNPLLRGLKGKSNSDSNSKAELIRRLKGNPEKRQFLLDVFKATKAFLTSMNNVNVNNDNDAVSQKEEDLHLSASSSQSQAEISPFGGVKINTFNAPKESITSVVELLRSALQSKYKRHVRRCFKELDVESLMNILYLSYEDTTKRFVSPEIRSQFFSSFSCNDNEDDCLDFDMDYEVNVTESQMRDDLVYEAEEISPFLGNSQSYPYGDAFFHVDGSYSFMDNLDKTEFFGSSILEEASSFEEEQKILAKRFFLPNPLFPQSYAKDIMHVQDDRFDIFSKIINLQTALFEYPSILTFEESLITTSEHDDNDKINVDVASPLKNLLEYFTQLRSIAETKLANDGDSNGISGNGDRAYSRSLIDYKLMLIKMKKLESNYSKHLDHKNEQSRGLDQLIFKWEATVEKANEEAFNSIKSFVKDSVTFETIHKKKSEFELSKILSDLRSINGSLSETVNFVKSSTKSLRARRHYLEASLDALMRHYESTMQKYQVKLDELQLVVEGNKKATEKLQKKFKHVEETYDEMRAMRRLKELLQNMQKAEAIKQNWAARKIQMQWRKYKLAKLRKKKIKGKKKGKKKTPPPQGKGSTTASPSKASTPASRSRSKSQTP